MLAFSGLMYPEYPDSRDNNGYFVLCTVNRRDLPSAVDLDALNSKPFKDATQADSIRKLEQRLEGVAAKGDPSFS